MGSGAGLPDYAGLTASPAYTTQPVIGGVPTGDEETTRTIGQALAIDWNTASDGFTFAAASPVPVPAAYGSSVQVCFV